MYTEEATNNIHLPSSCVIRYSKQFSVLATTSEQSVNLMLALISGHSHLQYLIACSIQTWRGKAWDIWSHAVMSSRHIGGGA